MNSETQPATPEDEMLPEYDFRGGVRGKYAARFAASTPPVVVELAPDVALAFPDSAAVNEALRTLLRVLHSSAPQIPQSSS